MTSLVKFLSCAAIAGLLSTTASAHHSFAAEFLGTETLTIEGTVSEVWFKNPHVRYYVVVNTEDGETQTWDVRTSNPSLLARRGWTRDSIKEGDKVTVEGFAGRDGRKLLSLISIHLPDGTVLGTEY